MFLEAFSAFFFVVVFVVCMVVLYAVFSLRQSARRSGGAIAPVPIDYAHALDAYPQLRQNLSEMQPFAHFDPDAYQDVVDACGSVAAIVISIRNDLVACAPGVKSSPNATHPENENLLILTGAYDREALVNYGTTRPSQFQRNYLLMYASNCRDRVRLGVSKMRLGAQIQGTEVLARSGAVVDNAWVLDLLWDELSAHLENMLYAVRDECSRQRTRLSLNYVFDYDGMYDTAYSPAVA